MFVFVFVRNLLPSIACMREPTGPTFPRSGRKQTKQVTSRQCRCSRIIYRHAIVSGWFIFRNHINILTAIEEQHAQALPGTETKAECTELSTIKPQLVAPPKVVESTPVEVTGTTDVDEIQSGKSKLLTKTSSDNVDTIEPKTKNM